MSIFDIKVPETFYSAMVFVSLVILLLGIWLYYNPKDQFTSDLSILCILAGGIMLAFFVIEWREEHKKRVNPSFKIITH